MKRGFLEVVLYILGGFQALYFEDVHTPQLPHSFPIQLCGLLLSALFLSIFFLPYSFDIDTMASGCVLLWNSCACEQVGLCVFI